MEQATGGSKAGIAFQSVNSNFIAGNNLNFNVNNTTVNHNHESSILTRLNTALNPVTSASYDAYEADQRSECFPNTRVQVLNDIEAWIHGESHQAPIYVLDGIAGIGKSTIAQTIAAKAAALGLLGASFFFSRDEDVRMIAKYFFPTIAYQLACYNDHLAISISHCLDKNPHAPGKRLDEQCSLLFLDPLEGFLSQKSKPTLLVVDALDECQEENAEKLLSLLGQYIHCLNGLKVFITMRPEAHLRDILNQDKNHERFRLHEIEDSIVHSDIQLYLESRLSAEEIRRVSLNRRSSWQPTAKDMEMLCGICGTLFIIAATATKFILDRKRLNPEKQLARLLDGVSVSDFSGSKPTHVLDDTYVRIILAAQSDPDEIDEVWLRDLNRVLGALIAIANPLPCKALASLLDMETEEVEATLSQLHSLVAPSGSEEEMVFRIHHKSFPDFITSRERIRQVLSRSKSTIYNGLDLLLWVDIGGQHLDLAKACIYIMNRDLKWNTAAINKENWYNDKDDIPHVGPQLIARDLAYASLHWASHLRSACGFDTDLEVQNGLNEWASSHILAWMEVMVILNQVNEIHGTLQDAIESIKGLTRMAWTEQVQELLLDASRFVKQGSEVMKLSPIHIYRSCLPFIPTNTSLARAYRKRGMLEVGFGTNLHWDPLLATLIGHSIGVGSVSFSGDGSRLASGAHDNTIRLWDTKTGAHVYTLAGHSSSVSSVAFSSDSSQLASGSYDNTIRLWDVKTGTHIFTFSGHTGWVWSVALSGNISRLASGSSDQTIRLWDTRTGSHISTLIGHEDSVLSVTFSIDGSQVASGSRDRTIRLWDVMTGAHISTLAGHSDSVESIAFSNDGSRLASGSRDKTIRIWDVRTGGLVSTLGHSDTISLVVFSSDDSQLASGSLDNTIQFWDAKTGAHLSTLTGHSGAVNSIAFSSDGTQLASASDDGTVRLWDPEQATHNSAPIGHLEKVWSIAFSKDGSLLASASADTTVQLWDAITGAHICNLVAHTNWVRSVAFSNDGCQLASGSDDWTIQLWDVKATTSAHVPTLSGDSSDVDLVTFPSDSSWSASGSDEGTDEIWDVMTIEHAFTLTGHSHWVLSVSFSPDGSLLASGSGPNDRTIGLWDAKTGAHLFTISDHLSSVNSVAFTSDSSQLASGSRDSTIQIWDAKTGECIAIFQGHSKSVNSVAFSSSGCTLASGSDDGTIQFWNPNTITHISTFTGTTSCNFSSIISLVFLQDDSQIVHRLAPCSNHSLRDRARDCLLALVKRKSPPITGLVMASLSSELDENAEWELNVVCWFPPDMDAASFAVDHVNSRVAIGCANGRVMALDFSSDTSPQFDP